MATFSSVSRQHVLQAIAEYDTRGEEQFLDVYGFAPAVDYPLVHEGRSYDSRAVLGVAHRYATGRLATTEEFSGDMAGAVAILRRRGFEVTEPRSAYRPPPPRATRAPRAPRTPVARATATREAAPAICPTCSMTLPATGICDECG
ncbi:MAG: hypothetical protein ABWY33_09635 [Cellulomonas sp.]